MEFSSATYSEMFITFVPTDTNMSPISYVQLHDDTIYVNSETLEKIVEEMYATTWDDFISRYSNGENFGINIINRIYVYVDKLSDAKSIATSLGKSGYNIVYALGAFDDMGMSVSTSLWVFLILGLTVLVVTTTSVLFSFRNYLLTSQKDVGILKFYGYTEKRIFGIYKRVIGNIFICIFSIGSILAISLSAIAINNQKILFTVILLLCLLVFLSVLRYFVNSMLQKICRIDTLTLIKRTKQVE